MKKILAALGMLFTIAAAVPMAVYGMDNIEIPTMSDNAKTVHVEMDAPDEFGERVEIYFNSSRYSILRDEGYKGDYELEPGEYKVFVMSRSDVNSRYRYEYNETIQVNDDMDLYIKVVDTQAGEGEEPEHDEHFVEGETVEMADEMPDPELIDFSDGKEYGTVFVTMKTYPAIKGATYRLSGNGKVYDIVLKPEYMGMAEVRLPAGEYNELSTLELDLDEDAYVPEGTSFLWRHRNNEGFFGEYYQIEAGGTSQIDDLYIVMVNSGEVMEFNSNALYVKRLMNNLESARESHYQEEIESAFPERFENESPSETIPEATVVEDDGTSIIPAIIIAAAVLIAVLAAVFVVSKIRRRSNR